MREILRNLTSFSVVAVNYFKVQMTLMQNYKSKALLLRSSKNSDYTSFDVFN